MPKPRTTTRSARSTPRDGPDAGRDASIDPPVLEWLLEPSQPSIRFRTLTELLHRDRSDPEVRAARDAISRTGWAAEILSGKGPGGAWPPEGTWYRPKYLSGIWQLQVLGDLGVTRDDPRLAPVAERWMAEYHRPDGGFWPTGKKGHLCTTGNAVRTLVRFGYEDDPRVVDGLDWLVKHQAKLGGWSCFGSGRNLDSWEPMSAFAAYPMSKWTPAMQEAVQRGAEFFLGRELYRQGAAYAPWERFHYPVHYYYDLLVGLDFLTALGFSGDPRMGHALSVLRSRRRRDGRWELGAVHPDVEGGMADWFEKHPRDRPTPLAFEEVGRPSKMVTLTALRVLDRVGRVPAAGITGAR